MTRVLSTGRTTPSSAENLSTKHEAPTPEDLDRFLADGTPVTPVP
ncbi:hypothetical protein GCM10023215_62390 [Pseudonocardia yuanmonensis]|uniref:Uncharacterized protein n=1 Tax=Pseudonocardia yuanmonensis TaxID=1095914 RepID=A0ABP8XQA0_9PSEU